MSRPIIAISLAATLLTACAATPTPTVTIAPTATRTLHPLATLTPIPDYTPTPSPTPYTTVPTNWLIYRNADYNFTFRFPPEWTLEAHEPFEMAG